MTVLTPTAEAAARDLVASGRFDSPEAAVETALAQLLANTAQTIGSAPESDLILAAADRLVAEAQASGWIEDFDFDAFLIEEGLDAPKGSD